MSTRRTHAERRGAIFGAFVAVCVGEGFGCKGAPAPVAPTSEAPVPSSPVSRYLPLVDGRMWAYDAEEDGTGARGMFVTKVRRLPGPRFSLVSSQGAHVLEVRADGIAKEESGAYVLRVPLVSGAEWKGEAGAMVRVLAVDRVLEVPAGKFVGCLDTVEEVPGAAPERPTRRVTTTYCPDVGIVSLYAEAWSGDRHAGERAVLRSFGKPVTIE